VIGIISFSLLKLVIYYLLLVGVLTPNWFLFIFNPLSAFGLAFFVKRNQENELYPVLIFIIDTFTPIMGFLGILIFISLKPVVEFIRVDDEEDEIFLPLGEETYKRFESEKRGSLNNQTIRDRKERLLENYNVEPLSEVIFGDYELPLKINAIDRLSQISNRESIRLLKHSLEVSDYEIRYFANGALEKLEKKFFEKIEEVSDRILEYPENTKLYNKRADLYLEVHRLGLLDKSIEVVYLERALIDYMTSLSLDGTESYLYTRIIEVNLRLQRLDDLLELAKIALGSNINDKDKGKILFYQAEANFIAGNFSAAKECCSKVEELKVDDSLIKASLGWWNEIA